MTASPTLAWIHLFPSDVSYTCIGQAAWLREALPTESADSARKVLVAYRQSSQDLPDLDRFDGIAAINCRDLSSDRLEQAGFKYVRRFAVLPSVMDLRWLIALDSPAVSAGSWHLCAAVRASARVKHALVRTAAGSALPGWYRDHLLIAQRTVPPLENTLRTIVSNGDIRLAISSGAPGPLERRKPSLAILDRTGRLLACVKLAVSSISDRLVRHETAILHALASQFPSARAPRVLFAGEIEGKYTLVQSPIAGSPPWSRVTAAHSRFLEGLRQRGWKPVRATMWAAELRERVFNLPSSERQVFTSFQQFETALDGVHLPTAVVHGDFVPWNLRQRDGSITACDWENACLEGTPLLDEFHHRLIVGHLLRRWPVEYARHQVEVLASKRPFGLEANQVRALALGYLLDYIIRLIDHCHDDRHPMLVWYRELAARVDAELVVHGGGNTSQRRLFMSAYRT